MRLPRRSSDCGQQSDVGQAQAGRAPTPGGHKRLGLHRRTRRKPGQRRFCQLKERHAQGSPKGLKPTNPGELVQVSWRYEFYAVYDLPHRLDKLQPFVDAFAHRVNYYRPHDAIDGITPAQYLSTHQPRGPRVSYVLNSVICLTVVLRHRMFGQFLARWVGRSTAGM